MDSEKDIGQKYNPARWKTRILLFALALTALADICIYWNSHLYYKAEKTGNYQKRIHILERASGFFPFNDLVSYELGRAYFDFGAVDLSNAGRRDRTFQESIQNFTRSIRLNPGLYQAHFHLAQALLYKSYFSPVEFSFFEEYKKAARLTTFDSDTYFEVGKILLSRWADLSEKDREFTFDLLKNVIDDKQKRQSILEVWAVNVGDYKIMDKILPAEPDVYRSYAQFLGERSLSLEERQQKLSQAEYMEFINAKKTISLGEQDFHFFRLKSALDKFQSALSVMMNIRFYQNLSGEPLIDDSEFESAKKSVYLNLAKCLIERTGKLEEARPYLRKYLELEGNSSELDKLESFLKARDLLGVKSRTGAQNTAELYLKILLYFRQSRYREVIQEGENLNVNYAALSQDARRDAVGIYKTVGDSYQKIDFIYDAGKFYQKALEIDPDDLDVLIQLRKNYERLNDEENIRKIDAAVKPLLTHDEVVFGKGFIGKGKSFSLPLITEGNKKEATFYFQMPEVEPSPLITILSNGFVVWEDYLSQSTLSLSLEADEGRCVLQVIPVNREIILEKLSLIGNKESDSTGNID